MYTIKYGFTLSGGAKEEFDLHLNERTMELVGNMPDQLPSWTNLEFCKCPHCPLDSRTHPNCPLAANLVKIVSGFEGLQSYDTLHVTVLTDERRIEQETTAQRGISSLMGLVIATSGCPHTAYFRPMARFHLPLANWEETMYRATSMYMLAQYFLKKAGRKADFEMEGLRQIYDRMQTVNIWILKRLRSITETDSSTNAIVVLDIYAKTVDMLITESLDRIKYLFDSFFSSPQ